MLSRHEAYSYIQDVLDVVQKVPDIKLDTLLHLAVAGDRTSTRIGFYLSQELKLIIFDPQTLRVRLKT
jgi:hypothetical protein